MTISAKWNLVPTVVRNAIYGFSTLLLPLGLSFLATPVIVGALGDVRYGIYQLVLGFISYSFNLSFGRAITKKLAEPEDERKEGERQELISAAVIASFAISVLGAVLIWAITSYLVNTVFEFSAEEAAVAVQAFRISAVALVFTSLAQVLGSVIQGFQRFDVYSKIFNLQSLGLIGGNVALALLGFGVRELLLWNLVTQALAVLVAYFAIGRLIPGFRFRPLAGRAAFGVLATFSAGVVAYQVMANLLLLFERGLVTARFGPSEVGYYVVAMMFGLLIHGMASSGLLFLLPLSSELGRGNERLSELYRYITKAVACGVVLITVLLISNAKFAMTVWMGQAFAGNAWYLMILHTTTFGLLAIRVVSWQVADGLGHPGYNFWIFGVGGGAAFLLMLFAPVGLGTFGIAVARLIGFAIVSAGVMVIEKMLLGRVFLKMWLALLIKLGVAGVLAAFVSNFVSGYLGISWFNFGLILASGSAVYLPCLYLLRILDDHEVKMLADRLRSVLGSSATA